MCVCACVCGDNLSGNGPDYRKCFDKCLQSGCGDSVLTKVLDLLYPQLCLDALGDLMCVCTVCLLACLGMLRVCVCVFVCVSGIQ